MRNDAFWDWFDKEARPKLKGRAATFALMFEHLDKFDRPVLIVETGCARRDPAIDESWALDGCSTFLFDRYIEIRGDAEPRGTGRSEAHSVDIDPVAVRICAARAPWVSVSAQDSIGFLQVMAESAELEEVGTPDLIYLDAFDYEATNPIPSAVHHYQELMAALPMIRPDTLLVVDDSPATFDDQGRAEIAGKGMLVAKHMAVIGADLEFSGYQVGWTRVGPAVRRADPDLIELVDRARAHVEADRVVAAEHLYRLILGLTTPPRSGPSRVAHGEACAFYARLALARQKHGAAADWFREALAADPLGSEYRIDLILKCFLPMGNLRAATVEAERATKIAPDYPEAWRAMGGVEHEAGNAQKCIAAYDRQLKLIPHDPNALLDRATIALDVGDYERVREICLEVMSTERAADAVHCLGMVAYREHKHEEAIVLYSRAIEMEARDLPIVHWNMSLAMHAIGRYKEAWVEHEYREFQRTNPALYLPMRRFTLPRWKGEEPTIEMIEPAETFRKTVIHVHYEAGAGDNLCMARYLRVLVEQGYKVRYECAEEMVDLMRGSFPEVEVLPKAADYPGSLGIKPFDFHCPIGSLPAVLGTDIDSVPWSGPYIKPDPILVDNFRAKMWERGGARRIGLCWSSGIRDGVWMQTYGLQKSMHFRDLELLLTPTSDHFYSLQVGPERKQMGIPGPLITDLLPERPSWAETAALIANLDLVITVDTAVAHLAGAMGKPVWVMCQRDGASWHFMCWRPGASWNERSPWYPSAKVFRQKTFDQPRYWGDVVAEIAKELDRCHSMEEITAA